MAVAVGKSTPYKCSFLPEGLWKVSGGGAIFAEVIWKAKENPWIVQPLLDRFPAEAVQGLADAEGTIKPYHSFYRVYISNKSFDLLEMARLCLERLGIYATTLKGKVVQPITKKVYQRRQ